MFRSPHDKAGAFTDAQMSAVKDVANTIPDGEWRAYGRTAAGRLSSALASSATPMSEDQRIAASAADVTTKSAGVPQNVVTGQANKGDRIPLRLP